MDNVVEKMERVISSIEYDKNEVVIGASDSSEKFYSEDAERASVAVKRIQHSQIQQDGNVGRELKAGQLYDWEQLS